MSDSHLRTLYTAKQRLDITNGGDFSDVDSIARLLKTVAPREELRIISVLHDGQTFYHYRAGGRSVSSTLLSQLPQALQDDFEQLIDQHGLNVIRVSNGKQSHDLTLQSGTTLAAEFRPPLRADDAVIGF